MEAKEPKPDWRLRLGAFVLFCVTAFLPGMLFLGFALFAVDSALFATFGVHLPTPPPDPARNHDTHLMIGSRKLSCPRCVELMTDEGGTNE